MQQPPLQETSQHSEETGRPLFQAPYTEEEEPKDIININAIQATGTNLTADQADQVGYGFVPY